MAENTILSMENNVPIVRKVPNSATAPTSTSATASSTATAPTSAGSIAGQTVARSLEARRAAAEDEIARLIQATFAVIERTGVLDPKVSAILAEAGLSNQAFYRHFRGKHELLVAVLDDGIRKLADYLTRRMAAPIANQAPAEAVREWVRGMAAQAQDPTGASATRPFALARGRLAERFPVEVAASEDQLTAPLRKALAAARDAGEMPAVEPKTEAESLYHLIMGWVQARLVEERIPELPEVERLEAFVMAGLQREPAAQGPNRI